MRVVPTMGAASPMLGRTLSLIQAERGLVLLHELDVLVRELIESVAKGGVESLRVRRVSLRSRKTEFGEEEEYGTYIFALRNVVDALPSVAQLEFLAYEFLLFYLDQLLSREVFPEFQQGHGVCLSLFCARRRRKIPLRHTSPFSLSSPSPLLPD